MVEKNAADSLSTPAQLLFLDETTLSLHPPLRRCWMKRGQRKRIPAPGAPLHRHVFGAYHWQTGQVAWQQGAKKNSDAFITFLEYLAFTVYPDQRLIVVMDNASYHKSRATLAALAALEDRILVIWLPKYSPFLNPIERFWLHLKNLANANCLHPSLDSLQAEIDTRMTNQNLPDHPDRLLFVDYLRPVT